MKYSLHVPVEQYGFISLELEGSHEDACNEYKSLSEAFRCQSGLPEKEFNTWSDRYLKGEKMSSEDLETYQRMSDEQKSHVQWAKRSFKRIKK